MTPTNEKPGISKAPRHRSPNYPGISLKAAVEKITVWYKADGLVTSPTEAAMKHMKGDYGRVTSALKSFGLVVEDNDRIKLSQRGIDIVARTPDDSKRKQALKDAALSPTIYRDLVKEYPGGLPSDTTLQSELIAGRRFNPKSVNDFIVDFKATLEFAGISPSTVVESSQQDENQDEEVKIQVGDYVQWESNGILQLPVPKRVTGLSEDGNFAFVEGSGTGLPIKELTIEQPPAAPPPPGGNLTPEQQRAQFTNVLKSFSPPASGVRQDLFSLTEGTVSIQWPASLSPESFEDVSAWLDILKRKIGRSVKEAGESVA
jgi:hypothetical protein